MGWMDAILGKKYKQEDIDADNGRYGQRYTGDPRLLSLRKLRNKQLDEVEKERLQKRIKDYNNNRERQFLNPNKHMTRSDNESLCKKNSRWFDKSKV